MSDSTVSRLPAEVIELHDCATAEQLLSALSPRHQAWQPDPSRWIFRGQAQPWPLKAKAQRMQHDYCTEYGVESGALFGREPFWDNAAQSNALLKSFREALDNAGLVVPAPLPQLEPYEVSRTMHMGDPSSAAFPLIALAQHLGLPTSFLDWSNQARVAAYFAAADAAMNPQPLPTLVVWSLRRDFVSAKREEAVAGVDLQLETAPRASNVRLHAQGGVFTWLRGELAHETTVDQQIAELAAAAAALRQPNEIAAPLMRSFAAPVAEAPKLLRLLAYEGVDGASVFPGYEGVVRAMKERPFWDRK